MSEPCDCGIPGHDVDGHWKAVQESARKGKTPFIVRESRTTTYRVWAKDSEEAKDELYWQRSSGRPFPNVDQVNFEARITVD